MIPARLSARCLISHASTASRGASARRSTMRVGRSLRRRAPERAILIDRSWEELIACQERAGDAAGALASFRRYKEEHDRAIAAEERKQLDLRRAEVSGGAESERERAGAARGCGPRERNRSPAAAMEVSRRLIDSAGAHRLHHLPPARQRGAADARARSHRSADRAEEPPLHAADDGRRHRGGAAEAPERAVRRAAVGCRSRSTC